MSNDKIRFTINGMQVEVGDEITADVTLLDYIRVKAELRGTKFMCREAGCGACIVNVKRPSEETYAVNSCMLLIAACHGFDITTIEGVGSRKIGYHKLQTVLAENNGTQCGHCTPGWIMSMYSLLQNKPNITMLEIKRSLGGNICRCTGYRPILQAFKTFAIDAPNRKVFDIEDVPVCKKNGRSCSSTCEDSEWCVVTKDDVEYKDIIELHLKDGRYWFRVYKINDIFNIWKQEGDDDYMLVAGNTAKGAYPIISYPRILIDINQVQELKGHTLDQNLIVGGSTTLTQLIDIFENLGEEDDFQYLLTLNKHLKKVAHISVRNVGTVAGNLMIKHTHRIFPSDIFLLLETVGAQLTIVDKRKHKIMVTMSKFLEINMRGKIILNILFPPLSLENRVVTFKVMPRSTNAHAMVNAGFLYRLSTTKITVSARIVFGGLSGCFNRAVNTERYVCGKHLFSNETLQNSLKVLEDEMTVEENAPEPSVEYRRKTALGLFYKSLLSICPEQNIDPHYRSGVVNLSENRPVSQAIQVFDSDPSKYPITQPIVKKDGLIQCAGEAFYTEDLPSLPYEVFAAFVLSTVGSGEIVSIDTSKAFEIQGVVTFYTAKDIPGKNNFMPPSGGPIFVGPEEVLCDGKVKYFNQPIGIIVAESYNIATMAAKLVEIQYKNEKTPVIDIKEAVKDAKRVQLYESVNATEKGSDAVAKIIKGGTTIYGQAHFPMENIVCVIHPTEEGLKVYSSTHYLAGDHLVLAKALNIDQNCIDGYVRRVGGSYGQKISRSLQSTVACGLVVQKLGRPCRFIRTLSDIMRAVGKRLPCQTDYHMEVNSDGVIQTMDYSLYQDNGYTISEILTFLVSDTYYSCYNKKRWNFKSFNAITDTPKNTWFRAPGCNESVANAELIMERIAYEMSLDPIAVRLNNLDKEKYGDIEEMYNKLKSEADHDRRRKVVDTFNKENRWKKRGLRFSFMKWPTGPTGYYDVLLSVLQGDGSVVIVHGGVEIGQGINTKVAQIAAFYLNIPYEKIQVKGTDTITSPNNLYTAGSVTSQNICLGVRRCCEKLLNNIEPTKQKHPNASWEEIINEAFLDNIDLQVKSFVNIEDVKAYPYNVFGVCLTEVEIDVLTGEWQVLRVDLIEDVGKSVNPYIDIGQIEGAFIMGMGYWTTESLTYTEAGELLTNRTWDYYVPMCTDIPQDFRVYMRKNSYTYQAIEGAKAVGEPPICLAVGVALAMREAISEARLDSGIPKNKWFQIDGPSTVEKIALFATTKTSDFLFKKS